MITLRQILRYKPSIWTIEPGATVYQALELMAQKNVGALPVVQDGRLVGIFSERDYARKCILLGRFSKETLVSELMSSPVITVSPEMTISACLALMTDHQIRHLPVLEDEQMIGIVSIGDIGKAIISEQTVAIRDLEGYITGTGYTQ